MTQPTRDLLGDCGGDFFFFFKKKRKKIGKTKDVCVFFCNYYGICQSDKKGVLIRQEERERRERGVISIARRLVGCTTSKFPQEEKKTATLFFSSSSKKKNLWKFSSCPSCPLNGGGAAGTRITCSNALLSSASSLPPPSCY